MNRTWLLAGFGLVAYLGSSPGCASTQVKPETSVGSGVVGSPPPITWEIIDAEKDGTYSSVHRDFAGAKLGADAQLDYARKELLAALPQQSSGVRLDGQGVQCGSFGCVIDVVYDSREQFHEYEKRVRGPGAPLSKYPHGSGRTGLLKNKEGKLVAAWFFMTPGLPPDPNDPPTDPKNAVTPKAVRPAPKTGSQPAKAKP